ncbi:MAG: hypothetical protein ACLPKI_17375 [Streptosporangiaceae bacterium]
MASVGDDLAVRWVAVWHAPDHIHLVATLARQDQIRPKVWNDYFQVRAACQDAERQFGLRSTALADRTAARRPKRAESEQAIRRNWQEPPRARLRREVCTAAAAARTEQEFFTRLAQAGVLVRHRYSTVRPGQVTGYAVGLPEHAGRDGYPIWYGGGKLAADLTLPKLRTRWAGPQARDLLAGADQLLRPAVRAVLRTTVAEAAEHATDEAGFFTRLSAAGLLVRERFSEVNPGEVTGYAVTLPGCTGPDGTPRWFGGGRLHSALTLPRLREGWARAYGAAERSGASQLTGRNAPRSTATWPSKPPSGRSICATAPPPTRSAERTQPGPWPTRSTLPPGRPAAGHCAALQTPTTVPPAHRTAGFRATLRRETSFGPQRGCSR